jgi:hypothetical protein
MMPHVPAVVARLVSWQVTCAPVAFLVVYVPSDVADALETVSAVPTNWSSIWCWLLMVPFDPVGDIVVVAPLDPRQTPAPEAE